VTSVFLRTRLKLAGLIDRITSEKVPYESEGNPDSGQGRLPTAEQAEQLIRDRSPDLVAAVAEGLEAAHGAELAGAERGKEGVRSLLRQLAVTGIRADFESVYAHIYGSQIAALRTLRATTSGAAREALEPHLTEVKRDLRLPSWIHALSYEDWLGYLQRNGLVEHGSDHFCQITPKGIGFLDYVEGLGYPPKGF
jgi:hypothetical protein